ncbi:hypothetical protein EJB05_22881, partial [Eragrostis curvula]
MVTLLPLLAWLLLSLVAASLLDLLAHAHRGLPPGPLPLPVIGSLHLIGNLPHRSLARLAEIHGPLLSLRLGAVTTVVVSSSDVAREIMQRHDAIFAAWSVPDALRDHARNSVPWLPHSPKDHYQRAHRLDELQHLRREKVSDLVDHVRCLAQEGVAIDINRVAFTTSLNLISRTIFSCDVTDLDDHGDTSSNTVEWAMVELLRNPLLMDRTCNELAKVIGSGRNIEESEISQLPYLQAVIRETFRLHPPAPLLLPRQAQVTTEVLGHTIPKGPRLLVNVWAMGGDKHIQFGYWAPQN